MSKTLRTAALVVGAVALAVGTAGAAVGVYAGIGATAGIASASIAGLSVAALGTIATGLSIAATLTAKKPSSVVSGNPEQFAADPNAYLSYPIGRTSTAGSILFRRDWDTADKGENDRRAFLVDLGLGPIKGIEAFQVDQVTTTFGPGGQALGAYAGFMWQRQQLGACPEPAALGWGAGAGTPPGWTANHKLSGHAAAAWVLRFDTKGKHYQNGTPAPRWIVEGNFVYDPRRDSTYPGGSGPCRALDESTYVYSECPYLHGLKWALGCWQNGKRVMGFGAPLPTIDVPAFVEGANVSDLNGWKVGGYVYSGDGKWDTLKRILQAGMGEPLQLGAKISCFVNSPKVVLDTIRTGDIIGPASNSATQGRRARFNTGIGRYRSEAHNWAMISTAPIAVDTHVAEDGGSRTRENDYPLIQDLDQVGTAIRYDVENSREFGPITLPLKIRWMGYRPGDCVAVEDSELGLNGQPVLLLNRDVDPPTGMVTMTARSETAAKHPFALGQTAIAPPTPGVTGPPLVPVPGVTAWTIEATALVKGETTIPALVLTGFADTAIAEAIIFEYRAAAAGQAPEAGWISAGVDAPTVTRKVIEGIRPATSYEAAVSYRLRGVIGERLILGPVTAGVLAVDFDFVTGPNRPSNGADVTRDVLSDAWRAITTRSPEQVVGDLSDTANVAATAALRGEVHRAEIDGILYRPDGTTLYEFVDSVGLKVGDAAAVVAFLKRLGSDGSAEFSFLARNAAGGIVGIQGYTDDTVRQLSFVGSEFLFVDENNGNPIQAMAYIDGKWRMRSIAVDTIEANTIITGHVVPGALSDSASFSAPDVMITSSAETTMIETPFFSLGDTLYGKGIASVSFLQDATSNYDTSIRVRTYVDTGSGYQLYRDRIVGMDVDSGNARYTSERSFPIRLSAVAQVRIKVTGQAAYLPGGYGTLNSSWARDIAIDLFRGQR